MSRITPFALGLALPLSMVSQAALADLTPAQVWGDWRSYMQGMGYAVTADENTSGDTLTVSNLQFTFPVPDDQGEVSMTIGTLDFVQNADGTVGIIMPPSMPIAISGIDSVSGEPFAMTLDYNQTGHTMTASGAPEQMTYLYNAATVAMSVVTRALHTGTRLTVLPGFEAAAVDASDGTLISLVATALARIDTTRWRTIVLGGARPPADRPANTVTTYGMTETGSGVVYDRQPLDGVEIRIVDGEVELRCPMLLRCYRDGTDPVGPDGWFATGDLGEVAADGTLYVHGRRGDLIITGGENVWPEPVEDILRRLPAIDDIAIVGIADREWGQRVHAAIVPVDPSDPPKIDEIRDAVKAELPAFCAPHTLDLHPSLPRTALGKLRRAEVAGTVG